MPRWRDVTWTYQCDRTGPDDHPRDEAGRPDDGPMLTVSKGDHRPTGRSLVVNDQSDADAVARREGWSVGRHVLCPQHAGGGA